MEKTVRYFELPRKDTIRIACLGDSVTHGVFEVSESDQGEILLDFDMDGVYHNQLRLMLEHLYPQVHFEVINAGLSGDKSYGGLERMDEEVLSKQPDLCILCFGLNDSCVLGMEKLNYYKECMEKIIRKLGEIPVILLTPNMMCKKVSDELTTPVLRRIAENTIKVQNGGVLDAYAEAARELAVKHDLYLCDEYAAYQRWSELGIDTDGLLSNHINHPSRQIHMMWAVDLFKIISGLTPA